MFTSIKHKSLVPITALCACSVMTLNAFAQEAQPQDTGRLEEVLVTAERRVQVSQDVPVAMSAFSERLIRAENFNEPEDVSNLTPNFQQTGLNGTGGMGLNTVTIRGLGVSGSGNFILSSTSVLTYHDDIASGTTFTSNLPFWDLGRVEVLRGPQGTLFGRNAVGGVVKYHSADPTDEFEAYGEFTTGQFNLRRFEGAVSGPITDNLKARVSMLTYDRGGDITNLVLNEEKGEREWWGIRGIMDWTPTDNFTARLKYQRYEADSDTNFLNDAPREAFSDDELAFFDGLGEDLGINRDIVELDRESNFEQQVGGLITPSEDYKLNIWQLNADYDFGPVTLNSIYGYMEASSDRVFDVVPVPTSIDHGFAPARLDQHSLEFRLTSNPGEFGRFNFIAGTYLQETDDKAFESNDFTGLRRDLDADGLTRHNGDSPEDEFDGLLPAGPGSFLSGAKTVAKDTGTIQNLQTAAVFLHTTFDWTDRLSTTHSVRWTTEEKEVDFWFNAFFEFPTRPGATPETQAVDYFRFARLNPREKRALPGVRVLDDPNAVDFNGDPKELGPTSFSDDWQEFTGKFSADYKLTDSAMVYGSVSRGFKGGSFVALAASRRNRDTAEATQEATLTANAADPEISTVFEVGAKTQWFDDRLQVNFSAFFNDHEDFQATQKERGGESNILSNIPEVEIKGAELQVQARPVPNLFLMANFGVQEATIEEVVEGNEEFLDNDLGLTEESNISGVIRYDIPTSVGTFTPGASWRYRGEFWSLFQNNDIESVNPDGSFNLGPIGDFWEFNIRLAFESNDGRWYADAAIENVFDEVNSIRAEIPQPGGVLGGTLTNVNARRNWSATIGYRF